MNSRIPTIQSNWIALLATVYFCCINSTMASDLLSNSRYDALKSDFLNINPSYFSEIDISNMNSAEMAFFLGGKSTDSPLLLEEKTGGVSGIQNIFGANYACENSYGQNAACWYNTGGTEGVKHKASDNIHNDCGFSAGNDITEAMTNTSLHCTNADTPWSGYRFWLGTGNSKEFLVQQFPGGDTIPVNRFCAEVEFPEPTKLFLAYSDTRSDIVTYPHLSQLVNPSIAGEHLRNIMWEWGSYTSTKTTAEGTTRDQEIGSLYQQGGSHFYHKQTFANRPPADRIFAIDNNTLVACMSEIPTGVRTGMGDSYASNPFLTLGGHDSEGITNAANYLNYLTRVYWQVELDPNSLANYPLQIKINKIWAMYEENEILALGDGGKTLGVDMVTTGGTAYYPFTLWNDATDERTYRIFMASGSNTIYKNAAQTETRDRTFKVYIDANNNKTLDDDELPSALLPNDLITLQPNINTSFIIEHRPDFSRFNDNKKLYDKRYFHGSISFIEDGRLRSTGYAVRTWEGSSADIASKEQFFEQSKYASADSDWAVYHDFNLGKNVESNPHLLRNTPDFKNIFNKTVTQGVGHCAVPTSFLDQSQRKAMNRSTSVETADTARHVLSLTTTLYLEVCT